MKRKTLFIVFALFTLLCISTSVFATNDVKNGVSNVTDAMIDGAARLGNDVEDGIGTAAGAIENGVSNLGNTMSNGMQDIGNAVYGGAEDLTMQNDNGYTAQRTTASDITNTNAMDTNMWTWVIVAVAGIVIVGLVWYYAAEHEER